MDSNARRCIFKTFYNIKIILINGLVPVLLPSHLKCHKVLPALTCHPHLLAATLLITSVCCSPLLPINVFDVWLCNTLRSNTAQSNLSWHCVQLIWQSRALLFFSKVVIFLMSWNPCLGVNACSIRVLCCGFEFWKDSAFQFHVSYGSHFQYFTYPCLYVCGPCFLHSSSFLSLPNSNPVVPVSCITGYPCTRSNH